MRILITGVSGFVGRNLAAYWCKHPGHDIAGMGRSSEKPAMLSGSLQYLCCGLTNQQEVLETINHYQPDWVIHCAAMSKPNDCELQQELCYQVNVEATQYVIDACKATKSKLLFMSTDFVFGDNGPYAEEDQYAPVNYYGESKMLAEQFVKESGLHWAIVRTVLVYGKQEPGMQPTFPQWVSGQLQQGKNIKVFTDQLRSATYVQDLVCGIDAIVQQNAKGIFHIAGEEVYTPYGIAQLVAAHFAYNPELVQPATRADFAEPARRPICSTLDITKAKSELGYKPHSLSAVLTQIF
ncbi:MAG TPA: SDR family oxidoreductase [Phnomibacter sp.]|nr:SDR family oxidoreductase [Phnomibacter sp.]